MNHVYKEILVGYTLL